MQHSMSGIVLLAVVEKMFAETTTGEIDTSTVFAVLGTIAAVVLALACCCACLATCCESKAEQTSKPESKEPNNHGSKNLCAANHATVPGPTVTPCNHGPPPIGFHPPEMLDAHPISCNHQKQLACIMNNPIKQCNPPYPEPIGGQVPLSHPCQRDEQAQNCGKMCTIRKNIATNPAINHQLAIGNSCKQHHADMLWKCKNDVDNCLQSKIRVCKSSCHCKQIYSPKCHLPPQFSTICHNLQDQKQAGLPMPIPDYQCNEPFSASKTKFHIHPPYPCSKEKSLMGLERNVNLDRNLDKQLPYPLSGVADNNDPLDRKILNDPGEKSREAAMKNLLNLLPSKSKSRKNCAKESDKKS